MNTDNINLAIISHVQLLWWTNEAENNIKTEFGEDVLSYINKVCSYAANHTDWGNDDDMEAHNNTMVRIKAEYPFLKDEAVIRIANMAAYFWK